MFNKRPSFRRLRPRSGYDVLAVLATFVALGGTAYATTQYTGEDIIDGTLTGIDVQDGSIKAVDLGTELATVIKSYTLKPGENWGAIAECPAGKKALGGGYNAYDGPVIESSRPYLEHGWLVLGENPTSTDKTVTAFVRCAKIS